MACELSVRRASDRYATDLDWLRSRHCFSFGQHYDPANTGFGHLIVSNDDVVAAGTGFDTHPHRDAEIVTWVLSGSLVHQDSEGNSGVIYPGLAQRMSAGRGILHSEKNDSWRLTGTDVHADPVHFVQMWVRPDEPGIDPGYEQLDINEELASGALVTVASGMPQHRNETAIRIRQRDAALFVARLPAGGAVDIPDSRLSHVYVARGECDLPGESILATGDSVRASQCGAMTLSAGARGAEVLIWALA